VEIGKQLYGLMGIARQDKAGRAAWAKEGFRYFEAPAAIIKSRREPIDNVITWCGL